MQFLKTLATALLQLEQDTLVDATVLLPNRRSGQYLEKEIAQLLNKPIWLPQIFTLEDWVVHLSGLQIDNPIALNFRLFQLYNSKLNKQEGFEEFFPYGELLLAAFDLADRNLVEMSDICRIWRERTEIDLRFGDALTDDQKQFLESFWAGIDLAKQSFQKQKFLEELAVMPSLHAAFTESLQQEKLCYPGMAYRKVAQRPPQAESPLFLAGCHVLEPSTLKVLAPFHESGCLKCFWNFPSGHAMFETEGWHAYRKLQNSPWLQDYLPRIENEATDTPPASVKIIGAALGLGQVQAAADVLQKAEGSVSLLLPDPALLPPLLHALPDSLPEFNLTMGYPMRLSQAYSWCNNILQLNMDKEQAADGNSLDIPQLQMCLRHAWIRGASWVESLLTFLDKYPYLRLPLSMLPTEAAAWLIKKEQESWTFFLLKGLKQLPEELQPFETTLLHVLQRQLADMQQQLDLVPVNWSAAGYSKLFHKSIGNSAAPFEGLPLTGPQIMGLLEGQCLEFDHVVLLSANEDVFPPKAEAPGFFPLSLHKSFGLPMPEDKQNRQLEVFYSLMMRAKQVTLIYNQVSQDQQPAEPSRLIDQIRYEWPGTISECTYSLPFKLQANSPISISKTPEIMEKVLGYGSIDHSLPRKTFSASSINTWLNCRLQFYFSKILKEEPAEDAREELGPDKLGSLVHRTMELVYQEGENKTNIDVTKNKVAQAKANTPQALAQALREVFEVEDPSQLHGLLVLARTITEKYVNALLDADEALVPFEILGLEDKSIVRNLKLQEAGLTIAITGILDRIDKKGNLVRVADYKTGKAKGEVKSLEEMFDPNRPNEAKLALQGFVYAMLYEARLKPENQLKVELLSLRNLFSQNQQTRAMGVVRVKGNSETSIREALPEFEALLAESLEPLFDPETPFNQTEDTKKCTYCPYQEICGRNTENS